MSLQFPTGMTLAQVEEAVIKQTLKLCADNRTKTAKVLKIGIRTLQRKLKKYGAVWHVENHS